MLQRWPNVAHIQLLSSPTGYSYYGARLTFEDPYSIQAGSQASQTWFRPFPRRPAPGFGDIHRRKPAPAKIPRLVARQRVEVGLPGGGGAILALPAQEGLILLRLAEVLQGPPNPKPGPDPNSGPLGKMDGGSNH